MTYRLPREPSAPRLALWRAFRRLGAVHLGDGLVALPHSARNLEHLQWLAADIRERDGTSMIWHARPDTAGDHRRLAGEMRTAVDGEYRSVLAEAGEAAREAIGESERRRIVRRLRGRLRRIGLRDHFSAPTGDDARAAVEALAQRSSEVVT